jgi:hypothetical protein
MGRGKKGEAKMKIYATRDANTDSAGTIDEGASVQAFETRAEAEAWLKKGFDSDLELEIQPGEFADCWKKLPDEPRSSDSSIAPFAMKDLIVMAPGEHPGGNRYWVTPRVQVLIASME